VPNAAGSPLTRKLTGSPIEEPQLPVPLRAGGAGGARAVADPFLSEDYRRWCRHSTSVPAGARHRPS